MNSGDVSRAHNSDFDFCHLCLREHSLRRRARITRKLEWVSFPVLRTKDLNTRDFVVTNLAERRDHLSERQDSESRQQTVAIFQLHARQIFSIVDMEDLNQIRIERLDHFNR